MIILLLRDIQGCYLFIDVDMYTIFNYFRLPSAFICQVTIGIFTMTVLELFSMKDSFICMYASMNFKYNENKSVDG